jgi:hypothetical protein
LQLIGKKPETYPALENFILCQYKVAVRIYEQTDMQKLQSQKTDFGERKSLKPNLKFPKIFAPGISLTVSRSKEIK